MKWFLKVLTALSTGFNRWSCGATNWNLSVFFLIDAINSFDVPLSKYYSIGVMPASFNSV